MACGIEFERDGPGVGHDALAEGSVGGENFRQLGLRMAVVVEDVVIDDGAVAFVQFSGLNIAVKDVVVEIARMVIGGDQIDAIAAIGGIFGVAVDVAEALVGEQFAAEGPALALVIGDEDGGVGVDGAGKVVGAFFG